MHLLINTGGGDAPGLNAVIYSVVMSASQLGWKVTGVRRGYGGLLHDDPNGLIPLDPERVRGIADRGGTILGTVNKGNPFEYPVVTGESSVLQDWSTKVLDRVHAIGADGLIAVGGDGSLTIAQRFYERGLPVIGVPKTIDNDLSSTQATFGFDSAVEVATEAINRLHCTAEAHSRVMVVEVMGRHAGWIALHSGLAGIADVILLPEIDYDMEIVCKYLKRRWQCNHPYAIVVAAEGAKPKGGGLFLKGKEMGREARLGGIAAQVEHEIAQGTGFETRSLVLGHLQRGGSPTPFDSLLALRFGCAAVRWVQDGKWGHMVAWDPPHMAAVPIAEAIRRRKTVPLDSDGVIAARQLGICLGDSLPG